MKAKKRKVKLGSLQIGGYYMMPEDWNDHRIYQVTGMDSKGIFVYSIDLVNHKNWAIGLNNLVIPIKIEE